MQITFHSVTPEEADVFLAPYLARLGSPFDNYLESHILRSDFYFIQKEALLCGYFALCDSRILTQFYLNEGLEAEAPEIFARLLADFAVEYALVPTGDAALLSLCLKNHSRIETQSVSFVASNAEVPPAEFPRRMLRQAAPEEWARIHEMTDNLFDVHGRHNHPGSFYHLYVLEDDGTVYGYGLRQGVRLFEGYEDIGVYTVPRHREKGVARSMLLHLRDLSAENGKKVLTGCWFYNQKALKAMKSAGFASVANIKQIYF